MPKNLGFLLSREDRCGSEDPQSQFCILPRALWLQRGCQEWTGGREISEKASEMERGADLLWIKPGLGRAWMKQTQITALGEPQD